jgi:chromosome segregation ATPase
MHQEKYDKLSAERDTTLEAARKLQHRLMLRKKVAEEKEEGNSQVDLSAEPTQEELEAVEPLHMKNETGYYQSRIDRMKEKIKEERQRREVFREDPTVAYEKYIRARRDLEGKLKRDKEIDQKVAELSKDIKDRKKRWRQFREHLVFKTGVKFDEMLSLNKYAGKLDFDHKNGTLDLCVWKDNAKSEASQTKDVKALRYVHKPSYIYHGGSGIFPHSFFLDLLVHSGGERSYTTMCLLLALGESLETPFRILDEFDVFLDAEVRKLTIKALIHVAKKMNHRQFIFITPQDISSLKNDTQLKIYRLTPPARHTTVGGPSQQTLAFSQQASD